MKLVDGKWVHEYPCTECGGDAYLGYVPETIKRGKLKGTERPGWDGKVLPGERLCVSCGAKRGLRFLLR